MRKRPFSFFVALFAPPPAPVSPFEAFKWWERRRIFYNLIIGFAAVVSFVIYLIAIFSSDALAPGEDAIEPMLLLAAPVAFPVALNVCYTAGWLVDVPLRCIVPSLSPRFTSALFALGFSFSLLVVCFPAIYWSGYCVIRLLHITPT
jgi:hypothetical protein